MATGFNPTSYQLTTRNPADTDMSTLRFVPVIDAIVTTLGAMGFFKCVISTTEPKLPLPPPDSNEVPEILRTVWVRPGVPAFTTPATVLLYDPVAIAWVNAATRPDLWHNLFNTQTKASADWNKTDW